MTALSIGFLGLFLMFGLMIIRVPIGIALGLPSLLGIFLIRGPEAALGTVGSISYEFAAHWTLSAIPMFLLMGALTFQSGLASGLFRAARLWLGFVPGGLAIAANMASVGFSAASGSSMATAAAMGRLAIPEMLKYGYDKGLATGSIAAAGTIGALIPPSILVIVYAWLVDQPVGPLLMAGIIPGLLTAFAYVALIMIRCALNPSLAPPMTETVSWSEKIAVLKEVWPVPILVICVIGSIYSGFATTTEAASIGAAAAALIALSRGALTWKVMRDALGEAVSTTAMIFFIAIGASLLTRFLALAGISSFLGDLIVDLELNALTLVLIVALLYFILGMFLDPLGILLITLPVLLPTFTAAGIDMIWIGMILIKLIEIGLLTPPLGLNVFVVKGVVDDSIEIGTIFRGVAWFLLAEAVVMTLLIAYPGIITFLPSLMMQ